MSSKKCDFPGGCSKWATVGQSRCTAHAGSSASGGGGGGGGGGGNSSGSSSALAMSLRVPTIFGSVFEKGELSPRYVFNSIEDCYISYENTPPNWKLDDGSPIPPRKPFQNVSFDLSTRTFIGTVDWRPQLWDKYVSWEYRMIFAPDLSKIIDGVVNQVKADGTVVPDPIYREGNCKRVGGAVLIPSKQLENLLKQHESIETNPSTVFLKMQDIFDILNNICNVPAAGKESDLQSRICLFFNKIEGTPGSDPEMVLVKVLLSKLKASFEKLDKFARENSLLPGEHPLGTDICAICQEVIEETLNSTCLCYASMKSQKSHPRVHKECIVGYLQYSINAGFIGKCPQITCPDAPNHLDAKEKILPYLKWSAYVDQPLLQKYNSLAESYMMFLCGSCHTSKTTLLDYDSGGAAAMEKFSNRENTSALITCPNRHALELRPVGSGWSCNARNEAGGCKCNNATSDKPRWCCRQCDFDYCGPCMDAKIAALPPKPNGTPIICDISVFKTDLASYQSGKIDLNEFYSSLFTKHAPDLRLKEDLELWDFIRLIAIQIADPERRAALQLRHWTERPRFKTLCCKREHCFKCKTKDFHVGKSCAENVKSMDSSAMPCPKCGVYLTKSDGCDSVTCICSHKFTWSQALVLYKHVQGFRDKFPEDTAQVCADILCGLYKDETHESAGHWRQHNQALVDRLVLKSWHTRFQSCSLQVLATILLCSNQSEKLKALNLHQSAMSNYLQVNKPKVEPYIKQMNKSKVSVLNTLYPKPLDKYLALSYLSSVQKSKLSMEELEMLEKLQLYKNRRLLEWSKLHEEMIWKSAMSFLQIYGDNCVDTRYYKFGSSKLEGNFSEHFWEHSWCNKQLEYRSDDDQVCPVTTGNCVYAKRVGNVSSYPAAFSMVHGDIDVFQVQIIEAGGTSNALSFGVSRLRPGRSGELCPSIAESSSDGVGKSEHSIGYYEDRGGSSKGQIYKNRRAEPEQIWRKLAVDDILTAKLDKREMSVEISLTGQGGDFSHTMELDEADYCFAMTFATDHRVKILNGELFSSPVALSSKKSHPIGRSDGTLKPAAFTLTASGNNEPGGGTGRECSVNLGREGTEPWNKWFHVGANKSYIEMVFKKPETVLSFGLCSANDCPDRDPGIFELQGRSAMTEKYETIMEVESCPFAEDKRWQWCWFDLPLSSSASTYKMIKLKIKSSRRPTDGIQLGHWHVKTASSIVAFTPPEPPAIAASAGGGGAATPDPQVRVPKDIQVSLEHLTKLKHFRLLLKTINSLDSIDDDRIEKNLRSILEERACRVTQEPNYGKEKIREFVKSLSYRPSKDKSIPETETWNRIFDSACYQLSAISTPAVDESDPEINQLRAFTFLQDHDQNAGFMAARLLLPTCKEPKEVVMQAKAFAEVMPYILDEWYDYNASLKDGSLLPELQNVSKGCRCIPRCLGGPCKQAIASSAASSSKSSAGGAGGGRSAPLPTDLDNDEDFDAINWSIGCGPECNVSHSSHGNCLVCGRGWGNHGGHTCQEGTRGSWVVEGAAGGLTLTLPTSENIRSRLLFGSASNL